MRSTRSAADIPHQRSDRCLPTPPQQGEGQHPGDSDAASEALWPALAPPLPRVLSRPPPDGPVSATAPTSSGAWYSNSIGVGADVDTGVGAAVGVAIEVDPILRLLSWAIAVRPCNCLFPP